MKAYKPSFKLFYGSIGEFMYQYYGDLIRTDHLTSPNQVNINKFRAPGMEDDLLIDFWGYLFIKDGMSFLLSATAEDSTEIKLADILPIEARDIQKIANKKGDVFKLIRNPVPRKIVGEAKYKPKEFIDNLCLLGFSNPDHQKLLIMMSMAQLWDRSYFRVCGPAGCSKDSSVDVPAALFGGCGSIEKPTIAKLEDRASVLSWLVCNEVVGIQKAQWQIMEEFFLPAASHKNFITKHSRAFQNVQEIIDISNLSLTLFYNDVDHYPNDKGDDLIPYFDKTTKRAVLNRFPAFRIYGEFTEDFNAMKRVNLKKYVEENEGWYVDMIKTFQHYKDNYHEYLHDWNEDKLMELKGRDATNLGVLLKVCDFYSNTQGEFDKWMGVINDSMMDYVVMLDYSKLYKKMLTKLDEKVFRKELLNIEKLDTFTEKNAYAEKLIKGETVVKVKPKDTAALYNLSVDGDII